MQSCFIDGEAIVVDGNGLSVFELHAAWIWAGCGNLPKTSQANFRFAFDRGGAFNRGSCPAREAKRLCPGLPRYSSKCASVLRSTAICRLSFEHICRREPGRHLLVLDRFCGITAEQERALLARRV